MPEKIRRVGRRQFVRGVGAVAVAGFSPRSLGATQGQPAAPGVIIHAGEGLAIPPTADGRTVTIKVDSETMPAVRMSAIEEEIPVGAQIAVHRHEREDEIIFIRKGSGVATLGEREVTVAGGAMIYVPQNTWHGLRNNGTEVLGMTAIYSPPGFEQAFKDRLKRPNRTPAETEAHRKRYGIVYRDAPGRGVKGAQ